MEHSFSLPLTEQVKQFLLDKMGAGEWPPGAQVPAEQELSKALGVSMGTIRKAMDYLESAKFIVRQQGRGTYVVDPAGPELMQHFERFRAEDGGSLEQTIEVLTYEEGEATEVEGQHLKLRRGHQVRRFSRRRCFRGTPYLYEEIALPADLFPASRDIDNAKLRLSTSARNCGVHLGDAEERISAALCPATAAQRLGIQNGAATLRLRSVMLTIERRPARWREAYCVSTDIYYSAPLYRRF